MGAAARSASNDPGALLVTAATAAAAAEDADAALVLDRNSSRAWAMRTKVDRSRGVNTVEESERRQAQEHEEGRERELR